MPVNRVKYNHCDESDVFHINLIALMALMVRSLECAEDTNFNIVLTTLARMPFDLDKHKSMKDTFFCAYNTELDGTMVGQQIKEVTTEEERSSVYHCLYLMAIDFVGSGKDKRTLMEQIGIYLGISPLERHMLEQKYLKPTSQVYFRLLGLEPGASKADVKRAYRKLSLQFHPDRVRDRGKITVNMASMRFQRINEAYAQVLKEV